MIIVGELSVLATGAKELSIVSMRESLDVMGL